jgi:hypothetical protein
MLKRKLTVLTVSLCVAASVCSAGKIAKSIGNWRVEVGPAGNEFHQSPKERPKPKPPSQAVLRYAKIFVPNMKVTKWEFDDGVYEIRCEKDDEEYKFEVTPAGELVELQYENDETDIDEEADELVLRGTKKSIALAEVPKKALATLAKAYPNIQPSNAWTAGTIAGRRHVIQISGMAFYARLDGQIQAAKRVDEGGLNEIDPEPKDEKEFKSRLEELLGPYRQRLTAAIGMWSWVTADRSGGFGRILSNT